MTHPQPSVGSHCGAAASQRPPLGLLDEFVGSMREVPSRSGMRERRQPGMTPHNPGLPWMPQSPLKKSLCTQRDTLSQPDCHCKGEPLLWAEFDTDSQVMHPVPCLKVDGVVARATAAECIRELSTEVVPGKPCLSHSRVCSHVGWHAAIQCIA